MTYDLKLPLCARDIEMLRAGDIVTLSGIVYTARDAAHKKITDAIKNGIALPFPLENSCIYYTGPCPAAAGEIIGPCGPTTSGRMDAYTPTLIEHGENAMIGKGPRSAEVISAMKGKAVYFAATGGAAMLISSCVTAAKVIAYEELGAEAVRELIVEKMPLIVAIDAHGNSLYK